MLLIAAPRLGLPAACCNECASPIQIWQFFNKLIWLFLQYIRLAALQYSTKILYLLAAYNLQLLIITIYENTAEEAFIMYNRIVAYKFLRSVQYHF